MIGIKKTLLQLVPPFKDVDAFEFECRSCGHVFGEYDDEEE